MEMYLFESIKLIAQLVGALLVGWIAVRWALRRYKTEKLWERRLAALSDVVAAISSMHRVNRAWYDDFLLKRHRTEKGIAEQGEIYRRSARALTETLASARLILPERMLAVVDGLEKGLADLDQLSFGTMEEELEAEYELLAQALADLIALGRQILGIEALERGG